MNFHALQTIEARAEAENLMAVKHNIITPQSHRPVMSFVMDAFLGTFEISKQDTFLTKSEIMTWEGAGKRTNIFASAFGRDPQFFAFYRAMQAYEKALIGGETSLVLSPDSEFFKFFGNSASPAIKKR